VIYFCCDKNRRRAVIEGALNGIDFVEVIDDPSMDDADRQRTLEVYFVKDLTLALTAAHVIVEGGSRIRPIHVLSATAGAAPNAHVLTVGVDRAGDYSIYTLRIVDPIDDHNVPDGIDPILASVDFSFKVECPSDFDCCQKKACPPQPRTNPPINYLAKDYGSFRKGILDRMALLMPNWTERSPADLQIALTELLAYMGDHLSYQQDAVATEAYLNTARKRVSVKRHARLVDYYMHDGSNARTWVHVTVDADPVNLSREINVGGETFYTQLLTRLPRADPVIDPLTRTHRQLLNLSPVVFELMEDAVLFSAHNRMNFYVWDDDACCLPRAALHATLSGHYPNLNAGDVLLFEEVLGPDTGQPGDANPMHRQVVRLIAVVSHDESGDPLVDPLHSDRQITEIYWHDDDALQIPICLSSWVGQDLVENISLVRGNMVLADHGRSILNEDLGDVRASPLHAIAGQGDVPCEEGRSEQLPPRYQPRVKESPLTQTGPYDAFAGAAQALRWNLQETLPAIVLHGELAGVTDAWNPRKDLIYSDEIDNHFVAEMAADGSVTLRFGNDRQGKRPNEGTAFTADYRIGNGLAGNVGSDSLVHIVTNQSNITAVRNVLPASGGVAPETVQQVRRDAPQAFRTQARAVTEKDYADRAAAHHGVQNAVANFRWTGSWHTVFISLDRQGGRDITDAFESAVRQHLEPFRMAGHDLEIDGPRMVPLEIDMVVCVDPHFFRSHVKAALLNVFQSGTSITGEQGLFHPDRLTFGQTVYLSPLYAAAQKVAGVMSVRIATFQRLYRPDGEPLKRGKLVMESLEIPRLDNDPNFPEHGIFRLQLEGGK
jgi:hypothetical protein